MEFFLAVKAMSSSIKRKELPVIDDQTILPAQTLASALDGCHRLRHGRFFLNQILLKSNELSRDCFEIILCTADRDADPRCNSSGQITINPQ